jgi:hypothetical protein
MLCLSFPNARELTAVRLYSMCHTQAVASAKEAQKTWGKTTGKQRAEVGDESGD